MRKLVVAAVLLLAGCQANKPVEEMNYTERRKLAEQITESCYAQGVKPGTAEFRTCSNVEIERQVAMRKRLTARQDAIAARQRGPTFCQTFGNTVQCF